jgi:hypothetical protein
MLKYAAFVVLVNRKGKLIKLEFSYNLHDPKLSKANKARIEQFIRHNFAWEPAYNVINNRRVFYTGRIFLDAGDVEKLIQEE